MKKLVVMVLVVLVLAAAVGTGQAITWGVPDGDAHPYVGLLVFDDANGPAWRCSGTLIAPKVVLTAGHCTYGAVAARVWFDSDLTANSEYPFGGKTSYEGKPYSHPQFANFAGFPNTHDIGVVVLKQPAKVKGMGALPQAGVLDQLATQRGLQDLTLTVVGYGLQAVKPDLRAERVRYQASPRLNNLNSALTDGYNLQATNNNGAWSGGTCFGDSGGPVFYPADSNIVVAVTSFGLNQNCVGADFAYRVDTADSLAFVSQFLK